MSHPSIMDAPTVMADIHLYFLSKDTLPMAVPRQCLFFVAVVLLFVCLFVFDTGSHKSSCLNWCWDYSYLLPHLTTKVIFLFVFIFFELSCWVGAHCGIYKSSYNISDISYLNSPPPLLSFILPSPTKAILD
jgi:hypothetical protein